MSLTTFWKFVFVESASFVLQKKQNRRKNVSFPITPYMSIFGLNGLGESGAALDGNDARTPEIFMRFFVKSIRCVSAIWHRQDGRFLLFVHRLVFENTGNSLKHFAKKMCLECENHNYSEGFCTRNHVSYEILRNANEFLVSKTTRERLILSLMNTRQLNPSEPSFLVNQFPTANKEHAVQMFLRMAYLFNQDVQTAIIKTQISKELNDLYANKHPFGKPR